MENYVMTNYLTETEVLANRATVEQEIEARKNSTAVDWPTLMGRPILGFTSEGRPSLGLAVSVTTSTAPGTGLTAGQLAQLNANVVSIGEVQQAQATLVAAQADTAAMQSALAAAQAGLSAALTATSQEVEDLGDPIMREGSPYTLRVEDKHSPVIVNNNITVPSFSVIDAPATINVFNSSTNTITVSGSDYTGIIEIEGKGVATFFVTTNGTSVTTEGVGGRS